MRILAVGDLVGNIGLKKLEKEYVNIKKKEGIDFCIVNAENVAERNGNNREGFSETIRLKYRLHNNGKSHMGQKRHI